MLHSKDVVLSEQGKGLLRAIHVRVKEMNESEPTDEVSKHRKILSKAKFLRAMLITIVVTCFTDYRADDIKEA